jgi:hypothetical protein
MNNTTLITGIEIIIRNINGKIVYNRIMGIQEGKIYISVNMSTLPKGNYFLEINNKYLQYREKLIVY